MSIIRNGFLSSAATFAATAEQGAPAAMKPIAMPDWVTNVELWEQSDRKTQRAVAKADAEDEDYAEFRTSDEAEDEDEETEAEGNEPEVEVEDLEQSASLESDIGSKITPEMVAVAKAGYAKAIESKNTAIVLHELLAKAFPNGEGLMHSRSVKKEGSNAPYNVFYTYRKVKNQQKAVANSHLTRVFDKYFRADLVSAIALIKATESKKRTAEQKQSLKDMGAERRTQLGYFTEAVDLLLGMKWINDLEDESPCHAYTGVDFEYDADGNIVQSQYPIGVWKWHTPVKGKKDKDGNVMPVPVGKVRLSVKQFVNLDLDAARAKPEFTDQHKQTQMILETKFPVDEKKPGGVTNQTGTQTVDQSKNIVISNPEQFDSAIAELAGRSEMPAFWSMVHNFLNAKNSKGEFMHDAELASVYKIVSAMTKNVTGNPAYHVRYTQYLKTQTPDDKTEAVG